MDREKIILSDLDIKILKFVKEEKTITEILDEFGMGFSQCKRHIDRLKNYIEKRNYGTFRFVKLNSQGEKVLGVLKWYALIVKKKFLKMF